MAEDKPRWVVAPDEANIHIAVGPDAKLSPELSDALDNLARVLESEQDVQGFLMSSCDEIHMGDCRAYFSCKGVSQSD